MTETASPPAPPTSEVAGSRRLPRWAVLLVAAALVGSWSTLAFHASRAHIPTVSTGTLRTDLASGHVLTYEGLTEFRRDRVWSAGDDTWFSTAPIPGPDAPRSSNDPSIVAVAYQVDDSRSPIRVVYVKPFGQAEPGAVDVHALVKEFEAAGVQPKAELALGEVWRATSSAEWVLVWGRVTGVLALVALFAIRPTRGTRWFWFWLFYAPLGLGVLAYAALECMFPRRPKPGSDARPGRGRLIGVVGLAIGIAAGFLIPY